MKETAPGRWVYESLTKSWWRLFVPVLFKASVVNDSQNYSERPNRRPFVIHQVRHGPSHIESIDNQIACMYLKHVGDWLTKKCDYEGMRGKIIPLDFVKDLLVFLV